MKFNKVLSVFLVLIITTLALPIQAAELPVIAIEQLADGRIMVSRDDKTAISGFVSLTLTKETKEVVLSKEDATVIDNALLFADPDLDGNWYYVFVFNEDARDITIQGSLTLSSGEKAEEITEKSEISLNQAKPEAPEIFDTILNGKMIINAYSFDSGMKFEVLYSTKKNGKYKKITEYYYTDHGGSDSDWYGYFNNPKAGKKYYVKARVYTEVGVARINSSWRTIMVKTATGPIKNIEAKLTAPNELNVKWDKAEKASSYYIDSYGYRSGTRAIYDSYINGGGIPGKFDWELYVKRIALGSYKKRDLNFSLTNIDMSLPIRIDIFAATKKGTGRDPQEYHAIVDDEFCRVVQNINVTTDYSGNEVVFTFKSPLDLSKYEMKRRDFGGLFGTDQFDSILKSLESVSSENDQSLDRMLNEYFRDEAIYDFNLFVATKENGPYKRVKTAADFSDANNLKLTYKAKKGQELFYKIIPTVESIAWMAYDYPVLYDKTNVSYYVNFVEPAEVISITLPK